MSLDPPTKRTRFGEKKKKGSTAARSSKEGHRKVGLGRDGIGPDAASTSLSWSTATLPLNVWQNAPVNRNYRAHMPPRRLQGFPGPTKAPSSSPTLPGQGPNDPIAVITFI